MLRSIFVTTMFTTLLFSQLLTLANLTSNFQRLPSLVTIDDQTTPCSYLTGCICKTTTSYVATSSLNANLVLPAAFTVFCGARANISIDDIEMLPDSLKMTIVELSIQKANIRRLSGQPFIGYTQLRTLSLAINQISSITEDVFTGLFELAKLDLSINLLSQLPERLLRNTPKLEILDMSRNEITDLPPGFFQQLSYLRELDMSQNSFASIPRNFFNLVRLEKLNMAKNSLVSLTTSTFSNYLPFLHTIDFSENLIREVDETTFATTPAIQLIDLRNNLLPYINYRAFSTIVTLKALYLGENPFICDCKLQAFKLWTELNGTTISWDPSCPSDVQNKICGPKCSFPSQFAGTFLLTVDASRLICTTTSTTTTTTTTTSTTTTTTSTPRKLSTTTMFSVERFAALDSPKLKSLHPHGNEPLFSADSSANDSLQFMDEKLATVVGITIGAVIIAVILLTIAAWYIRAHKQSTSSANMHRHFVGEERIKSGGAGSASGESTEKGSELSGPTTVIDTSGNNGKSSHSSSDDSLYNPNHMPIFHMDNTFTSSLRGPAIYNYPNDHRINVNMSDPTNKHLQALLNAVLGQTSLNNHNSDQRSLVGSNSQSSPPSDKVYIGVVSPNSSAFLNNNIPSMLPNSNDNKKQATATVVPVIIQQHPSKVPPPTVPRSESLV